MIIQDVVNSLCMYMVRLINVKVFAVWLQACMEWRGEPTADILYATIFILFLMYYHALFVDRYILICGQYLLSKMFNDNVIVFLFVFRF